MCISGIVFCLEGHCYGQKLYQWQNFSWKEVSSIYCDYPLDMPWLIKSKFHSLSCHLLLCLFVCWIIQMEDGYIFKSPKLKSWDYNWRELMLTLSVTGTIVSMASIDPKVGKTCLLTSWFYFWEILTWLSQCVNDLFCCLMLQDLGSSLVWWTFPFLSLVSILRSHL